jgi:hypothetical protein
MNVSYSVSYTTTLCILAHMKLYTSWTRDIFEKFGTVWISWTQIGLTQIKTNFVRRM